MTKTRQEKREIEAAVALDMQEEGIEGFDNWLKVGSWVSFVTPGPIYHGQIAAITPSHYFLRDASWIADTGRLNTYIANPQSRVESEFIGDLCLERPTVAGYRSPPGKLETL